MCVQAECREQAHRLARSLILYHPLCRWFVGRNPRKTRSHRSARRSRGLCPSHRNCRDRPFPLPSPPPPRARNQPASESLMVSNGLKARRAGRLRFWMHLANADILRPSRETLPSASARIWGWRPGARPVSWNRATREYKHGRDPAAIGSWRQLCNAARFPGFMRLARPESAGGSGWCRKHLPQLAASRVGYHAYSW